MKILSIAASDIWPFGKNKGIPSIYASQKGFMQRGHRVYFLCPSRIKDLPLKEEYEGIYIYRFRLPFNISSLSVYHLSLKNIWTHLKSSIVFNLEWLFLQIYSLIWGIKIARLIKPNLIYVHGLAPVFPGYLLSRLFKTKLVIRVYGAGDLYWKWKSLCFRIKEFRDYFGFKIPADYFIITNDGNYADRLAQKLGVPEAKIRCWRNGADTSLYEPNPEVKKEVLREFKINPSAKIIISTSRLLRLYGLDKLVPILPDLFRRNKEAVCIICGEGPERKPLEGFIYKHNIQSRVLLLGMVDHRLLKRLLNAADIFILLAKYHNCTNTMWEAMVCGKCIITTENEAIKEVLTHKENAILVPPDKLEDLPKILNEVLNDDNLRNELGRRARTRASEILEPWQKRIEREAILLEELVKK